MTNKLNQIIPNENGNSPQNKTKIVEATKEITAQEVTILVSEPDHRSEELIKQGLQIFEEFELRHAVLALEFFDTYFSVMLHSYHVPTAMEKLRIKTAFESELGYPIEFSL